MENQKVPNYITLAKISTDDFIAAMDVIDSHRKNPDKKPRKKFWMYLIMNDELVCPATNKKVAYCGYDVLHFKSKGKDACSYHFNFYSEEGILFTIDHKIPKSEGGADWVDNIQPMLCFDNWEKRSQMIYT